MKFLRRTVLGVLLSAGVPLSAQVGYERIRDADKEPRNWLTYSGNLLGHRHSPLDQISAENVGQLKVNWVYQVTSPEPIDASPIVADGVMYVSESPNRVTALDTRTGRPFWKYEHYLPPDLRLCCGRRNRGVAILEDTVYFGTLDAQLIALDAKTGHVRWKSKIEDYQTGYSVTAAPLAIDGKVIVGIAGGEMGIRGFLDAYDAVTGKRLWRLYTIPAAGEPGNETWAGDSWKTGGAPTWVTGSYDPDLNLIYWGTGNPGPDWNGDARAGDNLYSDSLLAIDADTGKMRWYFQFTPHDVHDWDSTHVPVLFEGTVYGKKRKLVAVANRNAYYYVLDRETGKFLVGTQYAKQTWSSGLDDNGRPIRIPGKFPSPGGTLVYPSLNGATVWFSPSYDPGKDLFYVAVREVGSIYYKLEAEYSPGKPFMGGGEKGIPGGEAWGAIRALDAPTGKLRWEFKLQTPPWAGVLSTAGGLVFSGTNEGSFFALDAASGKPLWRFETGAQVRGNPISYSDERRQHIAVASGRALFSFALP